MAAGDPESVEVSADQLGLLRKLNLGAGTLHLASAVVMTVIAADVTLPITTFNLNGPPGSPIEDGVLSPFADVQLVPLTAGFLHLSAFFHFPPTFAYGNSRDDLPLLQYASPSTSGATAEGPASGPTSSSANAPVLSFVAKSVLTWQLYANVLIPRQLTASPAPGRSRALPRSGLDDTRRIPCAGELPDRTISIQRPSRDGSEHLLA